MNLLITGAWQNAKKYFNEIEMLGHKLSFMQQEKDALPCEYLWVEGVICNGLFLYHAIEKFVNLKYIQLTSAGYDRVPMEYIKFHNIEIHNAGGVYSIPMAEFAVCGVLQLYKRNRFFMKNQITHKWKKHRGLLELYNKTVCIVGCGSVGTECAKRFSAFGCHVIGVDIVSHQSDSYDSIESLNKINDVFSKSDIIVLTLPLVKETYHLINEEKFLQMKQGSVLVNIARGAVIDTSALIKALKIRLSGAVLDVFEDEPLKFDSPLWDMKNVVITPHNSFIGDGNHQRMMNVIFSNLEAIK